MCVQKDRVNERMIARQLEIEQIMMVMQTEGTRYQCWLPHKQREIWEKGESIAINLAEIILYITKGVVRKKNVEKYGYG